MSTLIPVPAATLPRQNPDEGAAQAGEQLAAYAAELRALTPEDWSKPTDCERWDVRQIAAHVVGALDEGAHLRVQMSHLRAAKRTKGDFLDALNDVQVADRESWSGPALVDELERLAPVAIRKRRRAPRFIRKRPVPPGALPDGATMAYLFDVIYPRDVWMHRLDTARATGRMLRPTPSEPDLVAQVLRDLSQGWHGEPWILELTGAVPGTWLIGSGSPAGTVRADAADYLRLLSGRPSTPPTLISGAQSILAPAVAARVPF